MVAVVGASAAFLNAGGNWTWPPDRVTLPEAVATGNYAEVVAQIEHGADPNAVAEVRSELLTSQSIKVTPLQAAVWGRNALMAKLLLEHGAIVGPTALAVLKCINKENGNQEVRAVLDQLDTGEEPACDAVNLPR